MKLKLKVVKSFAKALYTPFLVGDIIFVEEPEASQLITAHLVEPVTEVEAEAPAVKREKAIKRRNRHEAR